MEPLNRRVFSPALASGSAQGSAAGAGRDLHCFSLTKHPAGPAGLLLSLTLCSYWFRNYKNGVRQIIL